METTSTEGVLDVVNARAAAELAGDVEAYGPLFADDFQGIGRAKPAGGTRLRLSRTPAIGLRA